MAKADVLVLGAGMVGVCTALHLQRRGHDVCLVDRREPGHETSHGNAGLIQAEAVEPYAFPRDLPTLIEAAVGRSVAIRYHASALPAVASALFSYWQACSPARYETAIRGHSALILHARAAHAALVANRPAASLLRPIGYTSLFRTPQALSQAAQTAHRIGQRFGVRYTLLDGAGLLRQEPGVNGPAAGGIHWHDPVSVSDPAALVADYAEQFEAAGGTLLRGDAASLRSEGAGWGLSTAAGPVRASNAVIALGPWSDAVIRPLGYRLPLFIKRGYHRHFAGGARLNAPVLDAERGYVLTPMAQGLRLTTGAEFAHLGSPATPVQMTRATQAARELLTLERPVEDQPWLGNRPCTPDMLPVMGPADRHPGLWFNFGHAHQGFTLGPVCGELLADLIEGQATRVDPWPYRAARF